MLVLVLVVGLLYALPNIYGEYPAVQITRTRGGGTANELTLVQIKNVLEQNHIASKSIALENGTILVRFTSSDVQLRARETLISALGNNYTVALNLAPATPDWLVMLGAGPIKLGLDLLGGVHFLMEVDMDSAINHLQEQTIDSLLDELRDKGVYYETVRKTENHGIEIRFINGENRDQAVSWLTYFDRNLAINTHGENVLHATFPVDRLRKVGAHAVQQNIAILRNRINQLGVTEPLVQQHGANHIVVELPGIQDAARAKDILGATATLEFRLVNSMADKTIVNDSNVPVDSEIKVTSDGYPIVLYKQAILTGDHITDSTFSADEYNSPQVNIFLDGAGGSHLSKFTKDNIGKLMATLFVEYKDSGKKDKNGRSILVKKEEVINVATIQSRLSNSFRITGIKNPHEARQLSLLLRSGALIAPIQIVEERTVGPTLGSQNIKQGLRACLCGLVASMLFMVILYRKFGLIAITALIINLVLIIGIMSILPGATLTMTGIAGILLTLAVAVDANVLINERIKEELHNGRTVQKAIHEGYRCAFSSIVDANVTTLIVAIILYAIGTGSIKGFAITTAIGVATSMFTAIIGTRAIVNLFYGGKQIDKLSI